MLNPAHIATGAIGLCLLSMSLHGQGQGNSLLAAFRQAGIAEAPGAIPIFYVESEKARALGFQKSLQAGRDWYQKQLNVAVPIVLTVFDAPTYAKFKLTNPT